MQYSHPPSSDLFHLASRLDELSAGCDPDFDSAYEELDREFAELRLQLSNA